MSTTADCLPQYSLNFDGASSMGLTNANQPTWGNVQSFSIRFKRSVTATEEFLWSKSGEGDPLSGFCCKIQSDGKIYFIIGVSVTIGMITLLTSNYFISTTTVEDSNWHQLDIDYDTNNATSSNRIKMRLDGAAETASLSSLTAQGSFIGNTSRFWWGCSVAVDRYFTGLMYNMGITASGTQFTSSDTRVSDGTAADFKSVSLAAFPWVDAGSVTSDWIGNTWSNAGVTASSTLGDASTP